MEKANHMNKEFPIEGTEFTISRMDYESLPCPMKAWDWTDQQMQDLAAEISTEQPRNYEEYWAEMESAACALGMIYYEDMTQEEYENEFKKFEEKFGKE